MSFQADPQLDPRDTWLPLAVEETLAWRLRRVPGLIVVPTVRIEQARRELVEGGVTADGRRIAQLLGARRILTGTCSGNPDAVVVELKFGQLPLGGARASDAAAGEPTTVRLGPVRLFEALDEATRWCLQQLGASRLENERQQLIFARPAASSSALEYYARALAAARQDDPRSARYYLEQVLDYDARYLPAQVLLAQMEMAAESSRLSAAARIRAARDLARQTGDTLTVAQIDLTQGLLLLLARSPDAARERFENVLIASRRNGDPYGELAAMNSLCDSSLARLPPSEGLSELQREEFAKDSLKAAAQWQTQALQRLEALGDVVSQGPAATKLAMICERLEDFDQALRLHQRTVALAQQIGAKRAEASAWLFVGQTHRRMKRFDEALAALRRALSLAGDDDKLAVQMALAEALRAAGRPGDALSELEAACDRLRRGSDLVGQLRCLRSIAELRMELGLRREAIDPLQQALDIAHVLALPDEQGIREQLAAWGKP